jgi:radical SAM superfamily enzyme YgiQ (UPF0313 family)
MKIALIFNPFSYKAHEENLRVVQKYFGLFPPLSLAWVASIIRESGNDAIIIDARTLRLTPDDVARRLYVYKPDMIGFMMTTYMFPETLEWIKYLKKRLLDNNIKVKVFIGGYNLRVYPKESLSHQEIDFGCYEHAYYTVPALLSALEKKNPCFDHVPGLIWKKNNSIVVNPHPQQIDFNLFPFPARDLLPNELYAEFPTQRKNFTVMVTSLGCPMPAIFVKPIKRLTRPEIQNGSSVKLKNAIINMASGKLIFLIISLPQTKIESKKYVNKSLKKILISHGPVDPGLTL